MKEISVIIPVYNAELYLEKCLNSLLAQDMDEDLFEIILVNDGSTDHTTEIIDSYIGKYTNIREIKQNNLGQSQARKNGIAKAKGKYIMFVDSDDWVDTNMLSNMLFSIKKYNADIVCCNYIIEYEGKQKIKKIKNNSQTMFFNNIEALNEMHKRKNVYQFSWNKIYKKSLFEKIIFPENYLIGEDYTMIVQLLLKSNTVVQILNAHYHYLQRKGSTCKSGYNYNHFLSYQNYINIYNKIVNNSLINRTQLMNYQLQEFLFLVIPMARNKKYNNKLIAEIRKIIKRNYFRYFFSSNDNLYIKGSLLLFLISPYLFLFLYAKLYT